MKFPRTLLISVDFCCFPVERGELRQLSSIFCSEQTHVFNRWTIGRNQQKAEKDFIAFIKIKSRAATIEKNYHCCH
jgi:hypothetical protein